MNLHQTGQKPQAGQAAGSERPVLLGCASPCSWGSRWSRAGGPPGPARSPGSTAGLSAGLGCLLARICCGRSHAVLLGLPRLWPAAGGSLPPGPHQPCDESDPALSEAACVLLCGSNTVCASEGLGFKTSLVGGFTWVG